MSKKKVAVIMGSDSDLDIVMPCIKRLKEYGITVEAHVMSAHRSPGPAADFASSAAENDFGVIIAAAGMAAHLAGAIAAHTILPVIGIPVKSSLDGLDALLSTVQMPPGVPVATVTINGAVNAAVLAIQILALGDSELADKLVAMKSQQLEQVMAKDRDLQTKIEA